MRSENRLWLILALSLSLARPALGAEYHGSKIDGRQYSGLARGLSGGKYYVASVRFEQDQADVLLGSGKKLQLALDNETIENPEEVIGIDSRGVWWALSIDGLDQKPIGSKAFIAAAPQSIEAQSS